MLIYAWESIDPTRKVKYLHPSRNSSFRFHNPISLNTKSKYSLDFTYKVLFGNYSNWDIAITMQYLNQYVINISSLDLRWLIYWFFLVTHTKYIGIDVLRTPEWKDMKIFCLSQEDRRPKPLEEMVTLTSKYKRSFGKKKTIWFLKAHSFHSQFKYFHH